MPRHESIAFDCALNWRGFHPGDALHCTLLYLDILPQILLFELILAWPSQSRGWRSWNFAFSEAEAPSQLVTQASAPTLTSVLQDGRQIRAQGASHPCPSQG